MLFHAYKLPRTIELYQLRYKPSKNERSAPYSVTNDKITAADWEVVKQYIRLLPDFIAATEQLQGNAEDEGYEGLVARSGVFMYFQVLSTALHKTIA